MTGEGPKVGISQEAIDRLMASGHIIEFTPDRFEELTKERDNVRVEDAESPSVSNQG